MWAMLIQSPDVHQSWVEIKAENYQEAYNKAKEIVAMNKERGIKIEKWQVVLISSHWEVEKNNECHT